jgi:hypothetical protein
LNDFHYFFKMIFYPGGIRPRESQLIHVCKLPNLTNSLRLQTNVYIHKLSFKVGAVTTLHPFYIISNTYVCMYCKLRMARGRCYAQYFLRFSPVFGGKKMAFYLKTNFMTPFCKNSIFWLKNEHFMPIFFGEI